MSHLLVPLILFFALFQLLMVLFELRFVSLLFVISMMMLLVSVFLM